MKGTLVLLLACFLAVTYCDVYMHSLRGSNDRLNEANEDRNNAQRLFDSQNNDKGGYCYGPPLSYYAGSIVPIEWTNQHSCGNPKTHCTVILQYTCGYNDGPEDIRIRDGTTTTTITDNANTYNSLDSNGNFLYGMHESYAYYQSCKGTQRNQGLFTSDQNLQTQDQRSTRQNAGATQYGFECPEERDYYPWWNPTIWKDIAFITDDSKKLCPILQAGSQNVASKTYCVGAKTTNNLQPITSQGCTAAGGTWTTAPSWGIPKPDCIPAVWNRDNHLGNNMQGVTNSYNWTLPTDKTEKCIIGDKCVCVLRIRYNITSGEIDGYGLDDGTFDDSSKNGNPPIYTNPTVQVQGQNLTLAVNTAQYGRTFQDRSFTFNITERPAGVSSSAKIYNLGVRGKRGNIVEVYPAVEYDFSPETLSVKVGDYVHFQWTGCDTNPAGNAGEGTDQTDRSNIAQIGNPVDNVPLTDSQLGTSKGQTTPLFKDSATRLNMALLGQTNCLTYAQLLAKNNNNENNVEQDTQNCAKLNAAPTPYFNGGLVKMTQTGTYYYMSTRNNNFTNRTQKGTLFVLPLLPGWAVGLIVFGSISVAIAGVVGGGYVYARKHPHGRVAGLYDSAGDKLRGFKTAVKAKFSRNTV